MKITLTENQAITVRLANTKPGDCIRFAAERLGEAMRDETFYLRLEAPEAKDRVRLACIASGKVFERDGEHRVFVHPASLEINP